MPLLFRHRHGAHSPQRLLWIFYLWILLAPMLTLGGTAVVVIITVYSDVRESAQRWILEEARIGRDVAIRMLEQGLTAEESLRILGPLTQRVPFTAWVMRQDGSLRLRVGAPDIGVAPPILPPEWQQRSLAGEELILWAPGRISEVALPIPLEDGAPGVFYLRVPHPPRRGGFLTHPERLLWGLAALLVLGLLLSWPLAAHLARPLRHLAETADALGRGDLSARVELKRVLRKDEIGSLALSFNSMADSLQRMVEGHKQLLADISHELRGPLTRLEVALELARQTATPAHGDYLDTVARQAARLEELIAELLSYARLDSAPYQLRREQVPIRALVEGLAAAHSAEMNARPVLLQTGGGGMDETVSADRTLLTRALDNVLRNAITHAPPHTAITLEVQRAGDHLNFSIVDQGAGVSPENLERIFQPFFRTDPARTPGTGGLGLGLGIARRCMEAHGGGARAERGPEGRGLRMRLWLPVQALLKP